MKVEEKILVFMKFFDNSKERLLKEIDDLKKDERVDEANIRKAQTNIYDIFKTMFQIASSKPEEECKRFFMDKVKNIPQNWKVSLEKAREFNDIDKIVIEEAKLEVVDEIVLEFEKVWCR